MPDSKKHEIYSPGITELPPLPMDADGITEDFRHYYTHYLGRDKYCRSIHYKYLALALTVRDRLMERWIATRYRCIDSDSRHCYYLSLEYLMGRTLGNAMLNLGIVDDASKALMELGIRMEELIEAEIDAGLGNGGLGRLAACFLDSCATLEFPVTGYGIRYEYGMFRQRIVEGRTG